MDTTIMRDHVFGCVALSITLAVAWLICVAPVAAQDFALEIDADLRAYSIWTEAQHSLELRRARLAIVRFHSGPHVLANIPGDQPVALVAALAYGPALGEATPTLGGKFMRVSADPLTFEYQQPFETDSGPLTLMARYRPGEKGTDLLDAAMFDDITVARRVDLWAEVRDEGGEAGTLAFSAFAPEVWWARALLPLQFADGTRVTLWFEDAWLFRGAVGETANRRLTQARVTLAGHDVTVTEYGQTLYAGRHHNWDQSFGVLFNPPVLDGDHLIHGIAIVECPKPEPWDPCYLGPVPGQTVLRYLDEQFQSIRETLLTSGATLALF